MHESAQLYRIIDYELGTRYSVQVWGIQVISDEYCKYRPKPANNIKADSKNLKRVWIFFEIPYLDLEIAFKGFS